MFVIRQLVARDRKRNLSSTFMGELWEVINPLINMVVMVLVFSKMFGKDSSGKFPLYILTGTTIYGLFSSGTEMCLDALYVNKNFLIKTQINKSIYIAEKILWAFRNFIYSLIIYAFMVALYRLQPSVSWLLVLPDIVLLIIMMIGIGKLLAIINATFADISYFYKIFTLMIFYSSALFYRIDILSPKIQTCFLINPVYIAIEIARRCVMENVYPDSKCWIILGVYAVGCYTIGTSFFKRRIDDIVAKM